MSELRPGKGMRIPISNAVRAYRRVLELVDDDGLLNDQAKAVMTDKPESDDKYGKRWLIDKFGVRGGEELRVYLISNDEKISVDVRNWYNPDL